MTQGLRRHAAAVLAAVALATTAPLAQRASPSLATVTEVDDRVGFIDVTVKGDAGGKVVIHYDFAGFYVVTLPILSTMANKGMAVPQSDLIADTTYLFPKVTRARVIGRMTHSSSFEDGRNRRDCWLDDVSVSQSFSSTAAPKATFDAAFRDNQGSFDLQASTHFTVTDRRKVGGAVGVSFQIGNLTPSPTEILGTGVFTDYDSPGNVSRTESFRTPVSFLISSEKRPTLKNSVYVSAKAMNFWSEHAGPMPLTEDFSAAEPELAGSYIEQTPPGGGLKKCSYLNTDERFTYDVKYGVAVPQTVDATLEPVDPGEATWSPDVFEIRSYKITLKTPDHTGVSKVRATIVGASSHPGIATNAGMHNLTSPECPFCTRPFGTEPHTASGSFYGLTVSRQYRGLNACALDALPDLYFRGQDNPDFTLVEPVTAELKSPIAQIIESNAAPAGDEIVFKIFVADTAASAHVAAEVEMGGQWFPVKAVGATADPLGLDLMVPVDRDSDGIGDTWARSHPGRATDDDDATPNAADPGDGLTVFEEYRGVFELGLFTRTDPARKDVFVTDYTGTHLSELMAAGGLYAGYGVGVHEVDATEHRNDVINWQPAIARQGPQYLIAIMMNPATPAEVGWRAFANDWLTFAGVASRVGPPRQGENTILLQYENKARPEAPALTITLAHEIGHLLGLPHHGDGDAFIDEVPDGTGVTHGDHYAAVRGGQHAGDESCFMRYQVADLLCKAPTLVPYSPAMYDAWPQPATTSWTLCATKTGTGVNAGGIGAGDASRGACLTKIRVKPRR